MPTLTVLESVPLLDTMLRMGVRWSYRDSIIEVDGLYNGYAIKRDGAVTGHARTLKAAMLAIDAACDVEEN